ncbi:MAG: PIN domain-containing protein [Prevotellaceae bacterium]|jgi:tRNA(fMet)-specific endonuclease VapC|nr:PIN domain-containing protein [Prevotellaceae bacterium]
MIRYILDTNICIFYLRGQLSFDKFISGKWRKFCCISEVTVLELYFGAENSNNPEKHHEAVSAFLQGLTVFPVSKCAFIYAKEKTRLRKIGKPIHDEFDLIIGTSAIAAGLVLVTDNENHFKNFKNIEMENWAKD